MKRQLVSVIIPVHNGEPYLENTLNSVLSQSYNSLDVVVVNDGSTDSSDRVLEQFKSYIRVFNQPQRGVAAARNRGILEARGEFVAFLDQDDWWLPEKIEKQINVINETGSGFVHTGTLYFDDSTKSFCTPLDPDARPEEYIGWCYEKLLLGNAICNSSVLVRRELFAQVGLCNPEIEGNSVQDYDLWLRFAQVTAFSYVKEPLTVFRLHPSQGTSNRRLMLREQIKVLCWRLPSTEGKTRKKLLRRLAALADLLGQYELDYQNARGARKAFWQSFLYWPSVRAFVIMIITFLPADCITFLRQVREHMKKRSAHSAKR